MDDDQRLVRPDGLSVRRRRHDLSYSSRDLVAAIGAANQRATGLRNSITPSLLQGIEERQERIPFATLRLIAAGLDCDPADILAG
jgi:DNA-binding Xre family transcriptional regulator